MVTIFGIKNCDTMKKAFTWLGNHKIKYTFHDYKKSGIDKDTISGWLMHFPIDELINTKGTTWKKLSDNEKDSIHNVPKAIELMIHNPSMIKRPVLHYKQFLLLGFKEEKWENSVK